MSIADVFFTPAYAQNLGQQPQNPAANPQLAIIAIGAAVVLGIFALVLLRKEKTITLIRTFGTSAAILLGTTSLFLGLITLISKAFGFKIFDALISPDYENETLLVLLGTFVSLMSLQYGIQVPQQQKELNDKFDELRKSINSGLEGVFLDAPLWDRVLHECLKARESIRVLVATSRFESPPEWDESISKYLVKVKREASRQIEYTVLGYYQDEIPTYVSDRVQEYQQLFASKGADWAVHKLVKVDRVSHFSLVIIDESLCVLLWDASGDGRSTVGMIFYNGAIVKKFLAWYQIWWIRDLKS